MNHPTRRSPSWRIALWGGALLLLVLPWAAMQVTAEVRWDLADFLVFGAMLAVACGAFEAAVRLTADRRRRWWAGAAILVAFLLVWAELAVGIFN
ncbi:hypothetical protein ACFJIX_29315 [Roseateles sp. UC29_93]|uniref:hypothetical protein n=1 Tax=Roseateles sp. UC29_93 TaxID=3350177 RepID=UPI00366DB7EB